MEPRAARVARRFKEHLASLPSVQDDYPEGVRPLAAGHFLVERMRRGRVKAKAAKRARIQGKRK